MYAASEGTSESLVAVGPSAVPSVEGEAGASAAPLPVCDWYGRASAPVAVPS